jgi:hypothetical protein
VVRWVWRCKRNAERDTAALHRDAAAASALNICVVLCHCCCSAAVAACRSTTARSRCPPTKQQQPAVQPCCCSNGSGSITSCCRRSGCVRGVGRAGSTAASCRCSWPSAPALCVTPHDQFGAWGGAAGCKAGTVGQAWERQSAAQHSNCYCQRAATQSQHTTIFLVIDDLHR